MDWGLHQALWLLLLVATAVETQASSGHCAPRHRERHGRIHYFDLLMMNPHGKIAGSVVQCPDESTLPKDRQTLGDGPVDTWSCPDGREEGDVCIGDCVHGGSTCFSGDSKVVVQGRSDTVAIRDVRVGDSVMCFEGGSDLATPGLPRWCTVRSFSRAEEVSFADMTRITLKGSNGQHYVTTVSWLHLMHVVTSLTHDGPAESPEQPTFTTAVIESVEAVTAMGKYLPSIESPYILVDGLAVPLRASWFKVDCVRDYSLKFTSPIAPRDQIAIKHYFIAPIWMATKQPGGTPGLHAQWERAPRSPFTQALGRVVREMSGVASFNLTRARDWFMPRYEAWLRDPSDAITEAQALEAFPLMFDPVNKLVNASCTAHSSAANPLAKPMALLVDRWGNARELLSGADASTCAMV